MIRLQKLPLDNVEISSDFGLRKIVVNGKTYWWHNGVDVKAKTGDKVYAVADGVVGEAKDNPGGYGNYVAIDHGRFGSLSGHLSKLLVAKNAKVKAGDLIGLAGSTGASTGPHLHFEIRECEYKDFWTRCAVDSQVFMRCVDPAPYIELCKKRLSLTKVESMEIMKRAAGYGDNTIQFFDSYLYRDDLFIKGAGAML